MTDTVFILGAGYSYAAGIPLLSGFVERMWQFAIRRSIGDKPLSSDDIEIFNAAIKIRDELDSYHGRAMFDDRNIEDILSILSFNMLGGAKRDKEKIAAMNRAIARTIDLSCTVEHPGVNKEGRNSINESGPQIYRDFWKNIFAVAARGKKIPTIITFNYDLVLERSLHQHLIGTNYNSYDNRFPATRVALNYNYDHAPRAEFEIVYTRYNSHSGRGIGETEGTILRSVEPNARAHTFEVDILKLHGSLNFARRKEAETSSFPHAITKSIAEPFILPPIFNKMTNGAPTAMWQSGLEKLRAAKNIVIVGYSLPQTDIYMQYFLKAALGPNLNLNKIFVFDPILFGNNEHGEAMKRRYEACFAPQLRPRIEFQPETSSTLNNAKPGTADHFIQLLHKNQGELIF
jgi:hypothetical protein